MEIPGAKFVAEHPRISALVAVGVLALGYFAFSGGGSASSNERNTGTGVGVTYMGPSDSEIQAATAIQVAQIQGNNAANAMAIEYAYKGAALAADERLNTLQLNKSFALENFKVERVANYQTVLAQNADAEAKRQFVLQDKALDIASKQADYGYGIDTAKLLWRDKPKSTTSLSAGLPGLGSFGISF